MRVFAVFYLLFRKCLGLSNCIAALLCAVLLLAVLNCAAQASQHRLPLTPRAAQAERFLAHRGVRPGFPAGLARRPRAQHVTARPQYAAGTAVWQPLGPVGVTTPHHGTVSGRISSIALDPSDATGNTVYVGTTGGGVWFSNNAATSDPAYTSFSVLTDSVGALNGALDPSISIGAVTVQPGGTGVILAGTGDPNDALDSYYGTGILRSADGGVTWSLIQQSSDVEKGSGLQDFGMYGLGFAGFAWGDPTTMANTVVAAVSEAYESNIVGVQWPAGRSAGLYYSKDAGVTWQLATIEDLNGQDVQGPMDPIAAQEGNPATSVVWNPMRKVFVAAVRYHGYYSSPDGVTWTQLATQPGSGFTTQNCPTNLGLPGSPACPVFRGTLAVNPNTGDTFAWSVDLNNQDQGIWQDVCGAGANKQCMNADITFAVQLTTTQLESNVPGQGAATIVNGDYNLALAAIPSGQDTMILAGENDLWQCTIAPPAGAVLASVYCPWRNTTNSLSCLSAQVGPYQHALTWNPQNPLEVLIGNDSGLWRSTDAVGETGSVCASTDASHFQNLNGGLGSLAEVEHFASPPSTPYTIMVGLGVNGTAGVKGTAVPAAQWPQILSGEGGPVVIDSVSPNNWYVNNGAGVSIHLCSQSTACTQADFGTSPVVGNADVANDGLTMTEPAPFLVDPVDHTQLLVGTCRLWRGAATGGWSTTNAVVPMLGGGSSASYCSGNPLIRTMTAMALPNGGETVYVGTYGNLDGGSTMAGHVLNATMNASGTWSDWNDLTFNPVENDIQAMNLYGLDISSIFVDPADTTGKTVYVTVQGITGQSQPIRTVYRSTDGGATWNTLNSNLPEEPANSVVVDPVDPNTVYVATDAGVYATRQVGSCTAEGSACWAPMGSGLPMSPVVALSAMPAGGNPSTLVAATYGRGVWQVPLFTSGTLLTTAALSPDTLMFTPGQSVGSSSSPLTISVANTGGVGLSITSVTLGGDDAGDFVETDNCANQEVVARTSCAIQVKFLPTAIGARDATITVAGNISGGSLVATLNGTGTAAAPIVIKPSTIDFGSQPVNSQSAAQQLTVENSSASAVTIQSWTVSAPFQMASNGCGAAGAAIPASSDCSVSVLFAPAAAGSANGTLTLVDSEGTHTVQLSGTATSLPTDTLAPTSLSFPGTIIGQTSAAQTITLTNSGQNPLTNIGIATSGPFTETTNCTTQLAAQSMCAINVVFLPTAAGAASGTLTLTDILSATAKTVALSGTGLNPPQLTPSVNSIDFGNVSTGQHSTPQTVTITNTGGAPMANVGFNITGPSAASFSVSPATCAATLAANASCKGQVVFTPANANGATASLAVSSSTHGVEPVTVALLGNGGVAGSGISLKPGSVSFAVTGVGTVSAAATITITNLSVTQAVADLKFSVSSGFQYSNSTCGSSLAAGATCTVDVAFAPSAIGAQAGTLTIASSALAEPATVPLAGTGFDFTVTAPGPVTVASGQTAIFTLSISTLGGAAGTFNFGCGSLPSQAACVFNPVTNNIAANATGTQTVDVTTSQTSGALAMPGRALLLLSGLVMLPLAWRGRHRLLLLIAALAVSVGAITSCAGASAVKSSGGGGGTTTTTTSAGTYTIPLAISANGNVSPISSCAANGEGNGAQRCVNLTMIVD